MRYSSDVMGTVFYVRGDKRTVFLLFDKSDANVNRHPERMWRICIRDEESRKKIKAISCELLAVSCELLTVSCELKAEAYDFH